MLEVDRRLLLEQLGDPAMHQSAARRRDVISDPPRDEVMGKSIAASGGLQHALTLGKLERARDGRRAQFRQPFQQRDVDPRREQRRPAQHFAAVDIEAGETFTQQHVQ